MRNIRKRLLITGVIIVVGLSATGCTKMTEATKDKEVSGVEAEDLPGAGGTKDGMDAETGSKKGTTSEETEDGREPNGQQDGNTLSPGGVPDREADLYASIYETGDMQFTVTEVLTEDLGDGTLLAIETAPGSEEESQLITVVYDENTVFEKQRIWNGGADHEEKAATAAGLQKGLSADIWGSYEGDVFHAEAVRIIEVIL